MACFVGLFGVSIPDLPDLGLSFSSILLHQVSGLVVEFSSRSLCSRASCPCLSSVCTALSFFHDCHTYHHTHITSYSHKDSRFVSLSLAHPTTFESTDSPRSFQPTFGCFDIFNSFQVDPRPLYQLLLFRHHHKSIRRSLRSFASELFIVRPYPQSIVHRTNPSVQSSYEHSIYTKAYFNGVHIDIKA
jgi:hypothetical protein